MVYLDHTQAEIPRPREAQFIVVSPAEIPPNSGFRSPLELPLVGSTQTVYRKSIGSRIDASANRCKTFEQLAYCRNSVIPLQTASQVDGLRYFLSQILSPCRLIAVDTPAAYEPEITIRKVPLPFHYPGSSD